MKKTLLLVTTMISCLSFGQFTQTNEPSIDNTLSYFLCDSNVTNYAGTTGTNVTWDYSNIAGVPGIQKVITVIDATTSPYIADFAGAEKATQIESAITTFFSSDANSRTSQGFIYNEPSLGIVKAKWTIDPQITHQYPMNLDDEVIDLYSGELISDIASSNDCSGKSYSKVDGQGTLLLAGNTYPNVLRLRQIDTSNATLQFGQITVIRKQFEYYDLSNNSLPLFSHTTVSIQTPLGAFEESIVLSKDQPTEYLSLDNIELTGINIYPNPASNSFTIEGFEGFVTVNINDNSGRSIKTLSNVSNKQSIDLDGMEGGMYYLTINGSGSSIVKLILKK